MTRDEAISQLLDMERVSREQKKRMEQVRKSARDAASARHWLTLVQKMLETVGQAVITVAEPKKPLDFDNNTREFFLVLDLPEHVNIQTRFTYLSGEWHHTAFNDTARVNGEGEAEWFYWQVESPQTCYARDLADALVLASEANDLIPF